MTFSAYRYITLLSSLPHLSPPWAHERPPISRIQLEQRLAMLTSSDLQLVRRIEAFMLPHRLTPAIDDAERLRQAHALLDHTGSARLHQWLEWWLIMTVLTAALRQRHHGADHPGLLAAAPVVGRQLKHAWSQPTFGLEKRYPWLETFATHIDQNDAAALEQAQLTLGWTHFSRARATRPYGLEDVLLYLLRWWLIERSCQRHEARARQRFLALLDTLPDSDSFLKAHS
ncbi:DUF2764 family protein [Kushneria phosphatilytica]|uniref:DUF2764 family protein n=1 Tax=Kushneria phosphatilytica TaxID=657387 RepID=A0A1S1NUX5_9GAMM|nr:DUF2764 family protein [Kushneria phosphatilytica]OHV10026.1 hypothetical protein BH688_10475 [Kushneria phosphatilytica]QEL11710.1 DUF2764 family protein [Kushneria phosphatilytica]